MKKKTSIIVLSTMAVLCVVLLATVIFIGGYKTNFFKRQFIKLGWVEPEPEPKPEDKPDYWAIWGWNNTIEKLDIDADVVFYGNSIIAGSDFRKDFPNVSICNLGYPGDNLPGLKFRAYTIAAVKPEKIFVMGGINYLKQTPLDVFSEQYSQMVKSVQEAAPGARIYLQSILPVADTELTQKVKECNIIIDSLASIYGCPFIDLFQLYEKDGSMNPEYTEDGIHLKPEHYDKWAEAIRPYIEE